jgi:hypothetical protein
MLLPPPPEKNIRGGANLLAGLAMVFIGAPERS